MRFELTEKVILDDEIQLFQDDDVKKERKIKKLEE
jgi:hypothetical protein